MATCRKRGIDAVFPPAELSEEASSALNALRRAVQPDDAASKPESLRHQVDLCRDLLDALSPGTHGALWAAVSGTLGNALQHLGNLTGDVEMLRAAEQAYRNALELRTRERAPSEWAMTQNNLGAVLRRLAELTGEDAALHVAEEGYRNALEVRTRERAPLG